MKKTKFLVLVLVVSIMLVGAGYAYWDQTLTIKNTVETGYLDVSFIGYDDDHWDDFPELCNSDLVTTNAIISPDGQSLDFTVTNFYPGAGASLAFVVENTGTVAAKIETVTGTILNNTALANALNYKFDQVVRKPILGPLTYEAIDAVDADNVDDLAAGLTNALKNIVIQPGEKLMLRTSNILLPNGTEAPNYQILMPDTISGSQFEDTTTSFRLSLKFIQVNY